MLDYSVDNAVAILTCVLFGIFVLCIFCVVLSHSSFVQQPHLISYLSGTKRTGRRLGKTKGRESQKKGEGVEEGLDFFFVYSMERGRGKGTSSGDVILVLFFFLALRWGRRRKGKGGDIFIISCFKKGALPSHNNSQFIEFLCMIDQMRGKKKEIERKNLYKYIIYIRNLRSSASVLGPEREAKSL